MVNNSYKWLSYYTLFWLLYFYQTLLPSRCTDGTNFLTVTYFLKTVLPLCDFIKELQA